MKVPKRVDPHHKKRNNFLTTYGDVNQTYFDNYFTIHTYICETPKSNAMFCVSPISIKSNFSISASKINVFVNINEYFGAVIYPNRYIIGIAACHFKVKY